MLRFLATPNRRPKEHQAPTSEEDCSYFANLTDEALEKGLSTLAYYTHRDSAVLVIGEIDFLDVLLANRCCKGRELLQDCICDLTLQRDTYL